MLDLTTPRTEQFQDPLIAHGWTYGWTNAKTVSVNVWLAPDSSYQVKLHVVTSLLPEILNSLTLSVNSQPIPLTQTRDPNGGIIVTGTIPQAAVALDPTNTLLEFHTDKVVSPKSLGVSANPQLLGIQIDWLQIDAIAP